LCVSLLTALSAVGISQSGNEKVTICHIPPGNPSAAHTITVVAPALEAHLSHGDVLGSYEEFGPNYVSIAVFALLLAGWGGHPVPPKQSSPIMIADSPISGTREKQRAAIFRGDDGWRSDALRILLVPLFVVLCYQFDWWAWRSLFTDAIMAFAPWLGAQAVRRGVESFTCNGTFYKVAIACTALDAFFGSIPLVWKVRLSVTRNLAFLAAYLACLSVLNLVRLLLGFALYLRAYPGCWLMRRRQGASTSAYSSGSPASVAGGAFSFCRSRSVSSPA
jgi:hypothetical protein